MMDLATLTKLMELLDDFATLVENGGSEMLAQILKSPRVVLLGRHIYQTAPEMTKSLVWKILDKPSQESETQISEPHPSKLKKRRGKKDPSYRAPWVAIPGHGKSQSLLKSAKKEDEEGQPAGEERRQEPAEEERPRMEASMAATSAQAFPPTTPTRSTNPPNPQVTTPSTEEITRSFAATPAFAKASSVENMVSQTAIVKEAIRSIQLLETYPSGNPTHIYQQLLQKISSNAKFYSQDSSDMSHLSTWMRVLDTTEAQTRRVSVFGLLDLIGFHRWFSDLVKCNQSHEKTRKRKARGEKAATTLTLNNLVATQKDNELRKKLRSSMNVKNHRGKVLSELVSKLGVGILFSPDIWAYVHLTDDEREELVNRVVADPWLVALLELLAEQLDRLVHTGKTDLVLLLNNMRSKDLLPEKECMDLVTEMPVEAAKLSEGLLAPAVDDLIKSIRNILGHRFADGDDVAIKGKDCSCRIFKQLYAGEWFGTELIDACLTMSDRVPFVKFGFSVQANETRPFQVWRKRIDEWRNENGGRAHIYICPLIRDAHFSALEINDVEKKIFHYDSMAKSSKLQETVLEEFQYLDYEYIEAPTPQQKDGSSCGPMTVRNIWHRMHCRNVGDWDDVLDPDRLRMEVVQLFNSCLSDHSIRRPRKRHFIEDGHEVESGNVRRVSPKIE